MVLALVILAIAGVCVAERSPGLFSIALALALASWYVTEGPRGRVLPRWTATTLVAILALGAIAAILRDASDVVGTIGRFGVWLTVVKLYDRRTARDHAHLMSLSLLLILVACLSTTELIFGVVLVVYAATGLATLLVYQVAAAHERFVRDRRAALGEFVRDVPPPRLTAGRGAAAHFRGLAAAIGGVGLALSSAFFVIFPRGAPRGLALPRIGAVASVRAAGFAGEIDLETGSRITGSREIVCEVEITGPSGGPLAGDAPLLLRGAVLDRYEDGRWTARPRRPETIVTNGQRSEPLRADEPAATVLQRFRFRSPTSTVFALHPPVRVRTDVPARFTYVPATGILARESPGQLWSYEIESCAGDDCAAESAGGADEPAPEPMRYRGDGAARIAELARAILDARGLARPPPPDDPARWRWSGSAARALAEHLRAGRYRYTLDLGDVVRGDRDPIDQFLFQTRRGHCEFFASALAALCRGAGIDARVVTGYLASERDPGTARYVVRAAHAHAWVETRTGPHRYATLDPTPPEAIQVEPADGSVRAGLERLYRRLDGAWIGGVIHFDELAQGRLFERIFIAWGGAARAAVAATGEWMARVNRAFELGPAGYIWLGIVAIVALIAAVAAITVTRRWRRLRRTLRAARAAPADARRMMQQLGFYLDALTVLARGRSAKPDWQAPLDFARGLASARPRAAAAFARIAERYYEARFAGRRLAAAEIAEAGRWVRDLATALEEGR
jgi:transglutaminase-like putative cysteine protease